MGAITDAYLKWSYEDSQQTSGTLPEEPPLEVSCEYPIRIIDTYGRSCYAV